ncbi:hypothetical protein BDQ12DRAFT_594532 [Crucibulum laeve]|uniref:Uncharacterized protein n=1 Tax=Crucibulum laeve TaxID=68775 RepID=A0A5C3MIY3_9AGAR|nr:hypothetical protein BDQ12DRAFT_594532 [Crucibulum laeve]
MISISRILLVSAFVAAKATAQSHTGNLFYFVPGLGACGFTNNNSQVVASVSAAIFNSYPGATPNPNHNPICQHRLYVSSGGRNVTAPIVDYFEEQGRDYDVGLSRPGFETFAPVSTGVVYGVNWIIL